MKVKHVKKSTDNYIDSLIVNQNKTDTEYFKNIYTKKDYYKLLHDVLDVIQKSPNGTIISYRYELFQRSGLLNLIYDFVYNRNLTPGLVIDFGTALNRDTIVCGRMQEYNINDGHIIPDEKVMERNTIFDLASTSKLFTTLAILKLCEAGLLDLNEPVIKYVSELTGLDDTTIFDLLTFSQPVSTDTRVDQASNSETATKALLTLHKSTKYDPVYPYTDMGAMALRLVIEKVTNMSLTDFVTEEILIPCKMENTFVTPTEEQKQFIASENFATSINSSGQMIVSTSIVPGIVHDPKARILGQSQGIAPGHAGFFSNSTDMTRLANALINYEVINPKHTQMIGQNVVGGLINDEDGNPCYSSHHGLLTFTKQLNPLFINVQPFLSGKSFISSGFAGTSLCVDPLNKVYAFVGGNRLHNRVFSIHQNALQNIRIGQNGEKIYVSPTGEEKFISLSYTKESENLTKIAMQLALQYQLLEQLLEQKKEYKLVREI